MSSWEIYSLTHAFCQPRPSLLHVWLRARVLQERSQLGEATATLDRAYLQEVKRERASTGNCSRLPRPRDREGERVGVHDTTALCCLNKAELVL